MIASLSLRPATSALALLALAGSASAQLSEVAVTAEIDFARGLAKEWSFVDLAEEVLDDIEREGVTSKMATRLALVRCEVASAGALNEREPEVRRELFERALELYGKFIEEYPYSDEKGDAEAAFVDSSAKFSLALSIDLEEAIGELAATLRARKAEVLTAAIARANGLIDSLKQLDNERTEAQTRQLYNLLLNTGGMLADRASATGTTGEYNPDYDLAIQKLEDLVFLAGEGTPFSLLAYIEIGKVNAYRGTAEGKPAYFEEAMAYYSAVVDQTIPADPELWKQWVDDYELEESDKATRFVFLERSIGPLMEACLSAGYSDDAIRYGLHYLNIAKKEGFSLSVPGYLSQLSVARMLMEVGGFIGGNQSLGEAEWFEDRDSMIAAGFKRTREQAECIDVALRLSQAVNLANKGNSLQLRAQKLISSIIDRPGVSVSPEVLLEAAQGQYYDEEFVLALEGYHRVLRAIDGRDQATRIGFGARVMNGIGNCYRKLDRPLEAAMAFREGCTTWIGDIEFDSKNAQGYYRMMEQVERVTTIEKDAVTSMVDEAQQIVATAGTTSKDEVRFELGRKAYKQKDYEGAIAEYEQIETSSDYWEKAFVETGVCYTRMKQIDQALRVFDEYLDTYLKDKTNDTDSETRQARRREASATAEFYRGLLIFGRAKSDSSKYPRVVELLTDFPTKYPTQDKLIPWTMQMVVESQLATGDRAEANKTLAKMTVDWKDSKYTGRASTRFYNYLNDLRNASTDEEQRMSLLREMAEHLGRGNDLASAPSFPNLRNESTHWMELGEWTKAEPVLAEIAMKFADDPERAAIIKERVLPDLGHALLGQEKVTEAKAVLGALIDSTEHRVFGATIIDWCRSVTGWVEGGGTEQVRAVPGANDATDEEFQLAVDKLSTIAAAGDKWTSCTWYGIKFQVCYTYHVWGQRDQRKKESARRQVKLITAETGNTFDAVRDYCTPEQASEKDTARILAMYGEGVLQSRFRWLASQVR